jgi:hypothetical protein
MECAKNSSTSPVKMHISKLRTHCELQQKTGLFGKPNQISAQASTPTLASPVVAQARVLGDHHHHPLIHHHRQNHGGVAGAAAHHVLQPDVLQ